MKELRPTEAAHLSMAPGATHRLGVDDEPDDRARTTFPADGTSVPAADDHGRRGEVRGRYAVGDELARGGMGRVLGGRDLRFDRPVAIKELLHRTDDGRVRFEREARIAANLQHPGIVSILDAGAWSDGVPFYVMELVTGASLDEVIAGRTTLAGRLALLPHVIAVADALAYAHGMRIIHRDLKPANVLVGEFGETVVIDWGLAKDLTGVDDAELPGHADAAMPAADQTAAGAIMGTPAYMPVEQARGGAVDERADVHALGAILYHVLAGVPPYAEASARAALHRLLDGPPPPVADRVTGAPADLVAIVNKAMARSPADRYPTAKELAVDLKRFQTGQLVAAHPYTTGQLLRRWLRRHLAAVVAVTVSVLVLVALGAVGVERILRERSRAEHQSRIALQQTQVALQQRASAIDARAGGTELVVFMIEDLARQLEALGRIDLLDNAATQVDRYLAGLAVDDLSDDELQGLVVARRALGVLFISLGRTPDVLVQARAALAVAQRYASRAPPGDALRQQHVAGAHDLVGTALLAQGETEAGLAEHEQARAILERLARQASSVDLTWALALSDQRIAGVLAGRDTDRAVRHLRDALASLDSVAAQGPADPSRELQRSIAHRQLAELRLAQGDTEAALDELRLALAIVKPLADAEPADAARQRELMFCYQGVGKARRRQGDRVGAASAFQAAFEIADRLAAQAPVDATRRGELVDADQWRGTVPGQGDARAAITGARASLARAEALATRDPTNVDRQRSRALAHEKVGDVLLRERDHAGAIAEYRAALAIDDALAKQHPTDPRWRRRLLASDLKLGGVLLAQGENSAALARYRAAAALAEQMIAEDSTDVGLQADRAFSYAGVGDASMATRDWGGALAAYQLAQTIDSHLAAQDATNVDRRRDVAEDHQHVGDALAAAGNGAAARIAYQAGLDDVERLRSAGHDDVELRALTSSLVERLKRLRR